MHSHSAGTVLPAPDREVQTKTVDVEMPCPRYPGFSENLWTEQRGSAEPCDDDGAEDWMPECFIATSGLAPQRFILTPPFSTPDEIRRQRFGDNPNDHWWLWKLKTRDDGRIKHQYLEPVKKTNKPPTLW